MSKGVIGCLMTPFDTFIKIDYFVLVMRFCLLDSFSRFQVSKIIFLALTLLAFLFRTMHNLSCTKEDMASNSIRFLDWRILVWFVDMDYYANNDT